MRVDVMLYQVILFAILPRCAKLNNPRKQERHDHWKALIKGIAVVFAAGRNPSIKENEQFKTYRRAVLRGPHSSDDFWIMAERIMHEYTREDKDA
jgi:hypothetical protein